jgi:hypothetical protein
VWDYTPKKKVTPVRCVFGYVSIALDAGFSATIFFGPIAISVDCITQPWLL